MSSDQDHDIALFKYKVIAPTLMEPQRARGEYFRKMQAHPLSMPGQPLKHIKAATMKGWYYRYQKHGFKGLLPKKRCDKGRTRFVLTPADFEKIRKFRQEHLDLSVALFYRKCLSEDLLGHPPMCASTLRRFLISKNLHKRVGSTKARKRFEMERFGQLWTGDYMHGPQVFENPQSQKKRKAILLAIIDDHSRIIVGASFGLLEDTASIERVFKEALTSFGVPGRIYLDNGPSFSSKYLVHVCAQLKIGLVHSKPYDSPSRGKIERFFRTVRDKFLSSLNQTLDLKDLNDQFQIWLRDDYHAIYHKGIHMAPWQRYLNSVKDHCLHRVSQAHLEEYFLATATRKVNKDATLSFRKVIYEVPHRFIGEKVKLRFPLDRPNELYLYDDGCRVEQIKPVDAHFNGRYRPSPRISEVSLHKED